MYRLGRGGGWRPLITAVARSTVGQNHTSMYTGAFFLTRTIFHPTSLFLTNTTTLAIQSLSSIVRYTWEPSQPFWLNRANKNHLESPCTMIRNLDHGKLNEIQKWKLECDVSLARQPAAWDNQISLPPTSSPPPPYHHHPPPHASQGKIPSLLTHPGPHASQGKMHHTEQWASWKKFHCKKLKSSS